MEIAFLILGVLTLVIALVTLIYLIWSDRSRRKRERQYDFHIEKVSIQPTTNFQKLVVYPLVMNASENEMELDNASLQLKNSERGEYSSNMRPIINMLADLRDADPLPARLPVGNRGKQIKLIFRLGNEDDASKTWDSFRLRLEIAERREPEYFEGSLNEAMFSQ